LALRLLVDVGISFLRNCWLADSGLGPTMEFRRSLLTSASPGRTAMVPAPIERSEVRGHDNRSENLQHLQRNSSAFDTFAAVSRAREARAGSSELRGRATCSSRLVGAAAAGDVVIFVLAKLLVGRFRFGADDGAQAVAADVGFAGSGRWRWCRRRSS
jgi:hypothetical protein